MQALRKPSRRSLPGQTTLTVIVLDSWGDVMKRNSSKQRLDAGSRFAQRRSCPRFAFDAPIEIVNPITKIRTAGRVTNL